MAYIVSAVAVAGCGAREPVLDDATQHLVAAQQAIEQGDHARAIQELDTAIALKPDEWAYFERGRLHAKAGAEDKAAADVNAGLRLDPHNEHLKFLEQELKKQKSARFAKGDSPTSVGK
jgi:Flp pilus assembly protein TadD